MPETSVSHASSWLRDFSVSVERFVRDEAPQTLIEFNVTPADRDRLYSEVGKLQSWIAAWPEHRAGTTVAAVQAAADAEAGDEAFILHFLGRLGRGFDRAAWDSEYGPATETFFEAFFHHKRGTGPWRYVRSVFRHAGIVVVGMDTYARLLDRLLADGTEFTLGEYLQEARKARSGLIRPFLVSHPGFKFSRATGEYLRRHRRGELSVEQLAGLKGYRNGFWTELLLRLQGKVGNRGARHPPPPILGIDQGRCCLVLRFDPTWQARGAYRLNERAVPYPEQRVGGRVPPRVQIGGSWPKPVEAWWGPGQTPVALFRASDGIYCGHSTPGGKVLAPFRGGTYLIVVDSSVEPALQGLGAVPIGQLEVLPQDDDESPYSVWQISLEGSRNYSDLGIVTTGRGQLPTLSFSAVERHSHPLGNRVFVETIPLVNIHPWAVESGREVALRLVVGESEREVPVPDSGHGIRIALDAPCQGHLRLEPRGFSSSADDLGALNFTLLPPGVAVRVAESVVGEKDMAHVHASLPSGWTLRPIHDSVRQLDGCRWQVPASVRVFDAVVAYPQFTLPISLRLPVVAVRRRGGGNLIWLESIQQGRDVACDLEGPASAICSLWCGAQAAQREVWRIRLDERGSARVKLHSCLDALQSSTAPCGRFDLRVGKHSFSSSLWFASARRIADQLEPFGEPIEPTGFVKDLGLISGLPEVGAEIEAVAHILLQPKEFISVARLLDEMTRVEIPDDARARIVTGVANIVRLAGTLDGLRHDLPEEVRACPEVSELIAWLDSPEPPASEGHRSLRVERWHRSVEQRRQKLAEESEAEVLVRGWRSAVRRGARSPLFERTGGHALSQAGRSYRAAMELPTGKLRNQALTGVICSLAEAHRQAGCGVVACLCSILEQLAMYHSGRGIDPASLEAVSCARAFSRAVAELRVLAGSSATPAVENGLGLADLSPWEGDGQLKGL